MAVTINPGALTSLANLKAALSISVSTFDDNLKLSINAATAAIEGYCGRVFARALIVDERHLATGGCRLVVDRPYLNSITSIEIEGATTAIDDDGYLVEKAKSGIIFLKGQLPRLGRRRTGIAQDHQAGSTAPYILISYDGGYVTAQQTLEAGEYLADPVTLPGDLEMACVRYAAELYAAIGSSSAREVASESVGDASVDYVVDGTAATGGLPGKVAALVQQYRKLSIL